MDKQQKIILLIIGAFLLAVLVAVIVVALHKGDEIIGEFVPPSFDEKAEKGKPKTIPEGYGTMTVTPEFVIGICAAPAIKGSTLALYFTSFETNTVWMKVRIVNGDGDLLGESGLIRPDEHLVGLDLSYAPQKDEKIYAMIISYEPDTYYSKGSARIELMPYFAQ